MPDPYLGELRLMSVQFAPRNWLPCNGQLLPINQHQALFALIGTTYGGDGRVNFALPDLRGRAAVHRGFEIRHGGRTGSPSHVVSLPELPSHSHDVRASSAPGDQTAPAVLAAGNDLYAPVGSDGTVALAPGSVSAAGGSQAHTNLQPSLALTWCIAIAGLFPTPD